MNKTTKQISIEYGYSMPVLQKWSKIHNVNFKNAYRKNFFNENFFEKIDSENKAYFLGFIMADGYVDKQGKTLTIKIQPKDIDILEKLNKEIESIATIKFTKNNEFIKLELCSKKLVKDLSVFSIISNKTKTMSFPKLSSKELYFHFLRGYFDGDGHIGKRQCALVVGSESFFKDFMNYLKNNFNFQPWYAFKDTYYHIQFNRRDSWFIHLLYKDSTISLNRKLKNYKDNWSNTPMEKV
jgi:hypothetical protein